MVKRIKRKKVIGTKRTERFYITKLVEHLMTAMQILILLHKQQRAIHMIKPATRKQQPIAKSYLPLSLSEKPPAEL